MHSFNFLFGFQVQFIWDILPFVPGDSSSVEDISISKHVVGPPVPGASGAVKNWMLHYFEIIITNIN